MIDPCSSNSPPRAFVAAPDPQRYFPAAAIEAARQKISRCIERGEGAALLVGPAGSGKSLLLEVLAQQFRDQRDIVSLPGAQLCSRRALLQMILFQLGLSFRGIEEGELRVTLLSHLRPHEGPARRMLLLVDEAESLPARLLEELRVLTNVVSQGQLLVSLVLAGNATLEERFAEPKMEVLNQRIATRSYLSALGREETFQYIRAQVAASGDEPDRLFAADGLEAMFAATDGVPRLLNQLGSQLLWMAQETGYSPLDGKIVQQAWSELQQLPAPWEMTSSAVENSVSESAVEFGELSLDDDDPLENAFFSETEADELEDDRPASIRLFGSLNNTQQESAEDLPESTNPESTNVAEHYEEHHEVVEQYDATDQLVEQLDELKANGSVEIPQEVVVPLSKNPFAESFDSEEVVLDRYLEFEGKLLATAQRVINHVDTSFAQQLSQCEVGHYEAVQTPAIASIAEQPLVFPGELESLISETAIVCENAAPPLEVIASLVSEPASVEPLLSETVVSKPVVCETICEPVACEPEQISLPVAKQPGELLLVEDLGRTGAAVVPGNKFRHLFSSLEKNTYSGLRNAE